MALINIVLAHGVGRNLDDARDAVPPSPDCVRNFLHRSPVDGGRFPDVPARPIEPIRSTDNVACERRGLAVRGGCAAAPRAAAVGARGDVRGDGDSTSRSARIGGVGAENHLGVSGPRRVVRAQVHVRRVIVVILILLLVFVGVVGVMELASHETAVHGLRYVKPPGQRGTAGRVNRPRVDRPRVAERRRRREGRVLCVVHAERVRQRPRG
mmetsp:Transcript_10708/g.49213  ORF Transcript_10708/g.49213 Transcript_10708/m.49213 type:complete len:211 (+) Transcript_10708:1947-2579(+)